jgi:thiosulfate/3-mercaptopyruvate sulfurtransferase
MNTLMDVSELKNRMAAGEPLVVLDVRWALGDPHGHEHYLKEHIPGALYVDLATQLAGPADPRRGRHPLPSPTELQDAARSWGIHNNDVVVAYDDSGNMAAARLWWLLRYSGLTSVSLLDGGLPAWKAAGFRLERGDGQAAPGDVTLTAGAMPVIDAAEASAWHQSGVLLDARAGERYRGEFEPVDPRAGHIPGAVSAPTTGNLDDEGRFLPAGELKGRFAGIGVAPGSPVAVYCGSGVTAAHEIAALEIAGITAALYPGSFSEWSGHPDNQVVTGPEPGGTAKSPAV